jgi:hypothetical protein
LLRTRDGASRWAGFAAGFLRGFAALARTGFLAARFFAGTAFFFPRLVDFAMTGTLVKAPENGKF